MARKAPKAQERRKRRTREHVIADQSLVHVQQFVVNAGFTSEAVSKDYGYDVTVNTFDEAGLIEGGAILIQLKAAEVLTPHADGLHFAFDLDMRDYDLWTEEPNPVFLILYEATTRRAGLTGCLCRGISGAQGHRSPGRMPERFGSRCRRSTRSERLFSDTPVA